MLLLEWLAMMVAMATAALREYSMATGYWKETVDEKRADRRAKAYLNALCAKFLTVGALLVVLCVVRIL